ncbi:MAG: hypothetical protein OQK24_09280 [Magnetovibrio sp.]|nr:hypothetical protein [Magnetovibrio sp.]
MNDKTKALFDAIEKLEAEIESEINQQQHKFHYTIEKKRIKFETAVRNHHKTLRIGVLRFLRNSGLVNILVSPIIYMQLIPLVLLDIAVSLFQFIIFPVYGIRKVPRGDFIVVDRHHLSYLNGIEKLNCAYCGYANGLLAYARQIAGRTEEYWCPIKHARKTKGQHHSYYKFSEFGDSEGYIERKKQPRSRM